MCFSVICGRAIRARSQDLPSLPYPILSNTPRCSVSDRRRPGTCHGASGRETRRPPVYCKTWFSRGLSCMPAIRFSTVRMNMPSRVSTVADPRCGVMITSGCSTSG